MRWKSPIIGWQCFVARAAAISIVCLTAALACAMEKPAIQTVEPWSNVFSGQEVNLTVRFNEAVPDGQRVNWNVAIEKRVVLRRETTVTAGVNRPAELRLTFALPTAEPRSVIQATVAVDAGKLQLSKPLFIFPRDPFADNRPFPPEMTLALFDPGKKTAERLESAQLQFSTVRNIEVLAKELPEMLIVGEDVSFREYRALPQVLLTAAASGCRVVCLAPAFGSLELPGRNVGVQDSPEALHLRASSVIADFDKRLDYQAWPGDKTPVRSSLSLRGKGGQLTADVVPGEAGWPWLEAEFAGGGRLIFCGFALISGWDDGPAPRHILWHALKHAARESRPSHDTRNDTPKHD